MIKSRAEFQTSNEWFWYLTNNLGCSELSLCCSFSIPDGVIFTRRYKYLSLLEKDMNEEIYLYNSGNKYLTRQKFINVATHRSILDIEIVLDVDDKGVYGSIEENAKYIYNKLKILGFDNIFFYSTGSKGFHIHCFDFYLRSLNSTERVNFRTKLLSKFNCDILKSSENTFIAIEGVPHWKSGKIKNEVII
jgi:hypothetical protein